MLLLCKEVPTHAGERNKPPKRDHQRTPVQRPNVSIQDCALFSLPGKSSALRSWRAPRRVPCDFDSVNSTMLREGRATFRKEKRNSPSELNVANLLAHPDLPLLVELVPETEQRVHESQIEAVLWSVAQLGHGLLVALEPRPRRRLATGANVRRELAQVRDREGRSEAEGSDPVVEEGQTARWKLMSDCFLL